MTAPLCPIIDVNHCHHILRFQKPVLIELPLRSLSRPRGRRCRTVEPFCDEPFFSGLERGSRPFKPRGDTTTTRRPLSTAEVLRLKRTSALSARIQHPQETESG
jgi:hypothetical protein